MQSAPVDPKQGSPSDSCGKLAEIGTRARPQWQCLGLSYHDQRPETAKCQTNYSISQSDVQVRLGLMEAKKTGRKQMKERRRRAKKFRGQKKAEGAPYIVLLLMQPFRSCRILQFVP